MICDKADRSTDEQHCFLTKKLSLYISSRLQILLKWSVRSWERAVWCGLRSSPVHLYHIHVIDGILVLIVTVCCVVFRKGISERIDSLKVSLSQAEAQLRQHSSAVSYFESLAGRQADASCDDNECVICFEPMVRLTVLPCGHLFCNACITSCLATNGLCPTCRRSVKIDELVEVKVIDICLSLNSSNRCSASVIKAVMTGPVFLQLDVITDKQTGTSVLLLSCRWTICYQHPLLVKYYYYYYTHLTASFPGQPG